MKKIVFLFCVFLVKNSDAQELNPDYKRYLERKATLSKKSKPELPPIMKRENRFNLQDYQNLVLNYTHPSIGKKLFELENGTGVFQLPLDRMPCLVPDMAQFNMPNYGKGIKITGMPPGNGPFRKTLPDK